MEDIQLTQLELLLALWVLTVHWALQESHGPPPSDRMDWA